MKRAIIAGVVLLLVAAAYGLYRWRSGRAPAGPQYVTEKVDRGPIVSRVTASGTLSAHVTVQVGSQVSGRIAELDADFNSPVKKGEVIARLDPQMFEAAVEQAKANHAAAQGNLTKAKAQADDAEAQLRRMQQLWDKKFVARADLDTAETTARAARASVAAAQGQLEQAKAALHQAEVNLGYTTIRSPIDGIVISRNVDVGQTVAASLQAPTLFVIAQDLRQMQVDTSVSEADVGKLSPGMPAWFTVDAYPSQRFEGTVRQIRNAPQTVQNVVTYDAVIDVANPDLKLKPGMTANVTFIHARVEDALRVPNAALRFRPPRQPAKPGGPGPRAANAATSPGSEAAPEAPPDQRTVWVLKAGAPVEVKIRTGITDGVYTQVLSGDLHAGDPVILEVSSSGAGGQRSHPGGMRRFF